MPSLAENFANQIDSALNDLSLSEWSVTETRERILEGVTPHEAFENIVPVLHLALQQNDSYAFVSCIWLASNLAELSGTTQHPVGLEIAREELKSKAEAFGYQGDLNAFLRWYRIVA